MQLANCYPMRFNRAAIYNFFFVTLVSPYVAMAAGSDPTINHAIGNEPSTKSISFDIEQDEINRLEQLSNKDSKCRRIPDDDKWVDRFRASTHSRLCYGTSWLDGLFGDDVRFQGENFSGKVSLGFKLDEDEGIDPRLRVRIRAKLPNASNRIDAFIGRVEEDSFVSNTEKIHEKFTNVGLRNVEDQDSEWLVGLGYRRPTKDSNGLDFSIGAKLSSGFSPYAKVAHRHLFQSRADRYARTTNTVFWREREGFGVSSNLEYTRYFGERNIAVLSNTLKYTNEKEELEWYSDATWHHSLSDKRGISSSIYARDEQENIGSSPEFGTTLTYIQPVIREWLYMEVGVDFRWQRDQGDTAFKSAAQVGVEFEMLLGDYYRRKRQK